MFSVAPNIVLAPNMTQNAESKHRTQNTNTAHIRLPFVAPMVIYRICHKVPSHLENINVHYTLLKFDS